MRNLKKAEITRLSLMLYFSKTACKFFTMLSLHKEDNISLQMSLDSHLAALLYKLAFIETKREGRGDMAKSGQRLT